MLEVIFLASIVVILLLVLYLSGEGKEGFIRHCSRGAYMRELNDKMEKNPPEKS